MRLTSVVLTSWISSITSKISWIAGWPWSNHVCVCVWVCVCVCLCAIWCMGRKNKNKYWDFLSGNLDFGLEKSWKNHGTFFWDFCGNPVKWKHFPRYWPFVRWIHRSPVNSPHKGQWRGTLRFSLIWAWTNGWINYQDAGDLRRHCTHYDVTVMAKQWASAWFHLATDGKWALWHSCS